jgi:hypothetical protein
VQSEIVHVRSAQFCFRLTTIKRRKIFELQEVVRTSRNTGLLHLGLIKGGGAKSNADAKMRNEWSAKKFCSRRIFGSIIHNVTTRAKCIVSIIS